MNECSDCGRDFGSVSAFDLHRVGDHRYNATSERPKGRRCLAEDELLIAGWARDQYGRWRTPARIDPADQGNDSQPLGAVA
jgi:hypothetical protein